VNGVSKEFRLLRAKAVFHTVRRAWQADAKGLMELVIAKHPRGANRCLTQKGKINERVDCFQRLIGRHFLRQVDRKGAARDVAYVSEEARTFYLKIESANADWKVTVDEACPATIEPKQ
jgi:hypothetical protein